MSVATIFERLRGRREQGGDAWSLARRVAGGEDVGIDIIIPACTAADMTTADFESAVGLCQRRAGWRRQLAGRAEIDREKSAVDAKIAMLDSAMGRAREQYEISLSPLRAIRERCAERSRDFGYAESGLREDLPPHVKAARESANRVLLEASAPLAKAEARREASLTEILAVEKSLATKPVASHERPESRAWKAARVDRDLELNSRLDRLRVDVENAAARIAELTPLAAEAKAKLDEAETAAYNF